MPAKPTLIEEVKRINIVIVYLQQWTVFISRQNSYVMDIDWERNCYSCKEFGHITKNCRNYKIVRQEKRLEYRNNENEEENLIVLNYVLVIICL